VNAEKALTNTCVYPSYYATKGSLSKWQSWEFMQTLAKRSVWAERQRRGKGADSVKNKKRSGAVSK